MCIRDRNVGDSYEGEWKDNKFNGQGTMIQTDGTKYKGGFVNGMEEGSGIQEDKNGNRYEGFFKPVSYTHLFREFGVSFTYKFGWYKEKQREAVDTSRFK